MSSTVSPDWRDEVIKDRLTPARLGSYLADTNNDLTRALRLYEWNMTVAAAVMTTTGIVEVMVRNSLDEALTTWVNARYPGRIWFDAAPLDAQGREDVVKARRRASRRGVQPVHGKVVAELNFGFWRYLIASRYFASLWVPASHTGFPLGDSDLRRRRSQVDQHMQSLNYLRNRAAHHEPLHRRDLSRDAVAADELLAWISPDARAWASSVSPLRSVLAQRPW